MNNLSKCLSALLMLIAVSAGVMAQTRGSISGTVTDPNGALVPGASVTVKGEAGQQFTGVTNEDGVYRIPAVENGLYTVTISAPNFKTISVKNVKVDVATPATVDAKLELGNVGEVVTVQSGGEVLQTETATVGSTITGRQIINTPIASRDALDLVTLMPGTNTVGAPRRSSVDGLPKGALSISIDGVDVQDNSLRSSDGFFTYVRPRVDAIEEVTVTQAATGADAGGDGAVAIKFVTKRGTNDYHVGGFWQRRHESLNSNYWYNNRDGLARQILRLNQYGFNGSGPIPFLGFGEGVKPFSSGKDKRFFFINWEKYKLPNTQSRTRTILTPNAQQGIFDYIGTTPTAGVPAGCVAVTGTTMQCSMNLFNIAAAANATTPIAARATTADPTIAAMLAKIRAAVGQSGTITNPVGATVLTRQTYNFSPSGIDNRKFLATRLDFNLTKKHSLEFVMNRQDFGGTKDFLNSQDERFPGFPYYAQVSLRKSYTAALRSSFSHNLVNEFRFARSAGRSQFSPGISSSDFAYSSGFLLDISTPSTSLTTPYSRNSYSARDSPTNDWTDSMTWIRGSHTINFGGQYKRISLYDLATNRIVPTVGFGYGSTSTETAIQNTFVWSGTTQTGTLPGASSSTLTEARNLYAMLIGHVASYSATAYLEEDGKYRLDGTQLRRAHQDTYGLFAQDSWKLRPNLTVSYGLRWQPQGAYTVDTANYARINSYADLYGISGVGNLYRPGTLTGVATPTVVGMNPGDKAYNGDNKNFAPSVGVVYSPNWGNNGLLGTIFGGNGKSVFRGGYSVAFVREGTALIGSIIGANPGGNLSASRSESLGNLTVGTNLRDPGNPNLTAPTFLSSPAYPLTLTTANSANSFDPNLKTGNVTSYSFGYQRELDKDTVVEFRYVGNRGRDLWRQHNLNELNVLENGVLSEYKLARQNLEYNILNDKCQPGLQDTNPAITATYVANCRYNFAYTGAGTNPLPISLAYISGAIGGHSVTLTPGGLGSSGTVTTSAAAQLAANYSNSLFRNTAFATNLSRFNAAPRTFGSNLEGAASRRANALAAGLPSNFFFLNPATATGGAFIVDNSARSWYDGGTIEVRRRLSHGLRVNASYTWAKAQSDEFQSNSDNFSDLTNRPGGYDLNKAAAVFDIRHAFKLDTTYDLPFGRGREFFSSSNVADKILGGWTFAPVIRWQSGSPIQVGNVQLVGMTVKDLQKSVKVRKGSTAVYWLPDDIIQNSIRAFSIDPLSSNGYGTLGAPTGRFIAPAGYGDCQQYYTGQCGFTNLVIYGPSFFKFDASLSKRINFKEKRNIEFRVTALDVLNHPNFRVGGWNSDVVTSGCCTSSFGQLASGSAYQDVSTTNDPGGRIIDLMIRVNW